MPLFPGFIVLGKEATLCGNWAVIVIAEPHPKLPSPVQCFFMAALKAGLTTHELSTLLPTILLQDGAYLRVELVVSSW